jgi:hypothetical protein
MRTDPLTLEHPMDRLELFDLNTAAWTALEPPELYLVDNTAVVPLQGEYMPDLLFVEIEGKGAVEFTAKNRAGYLFKLNCEVSDEWIVFFERHRGSINATVKKQTLTLRCDSKDLKDKFEKIRRVVHQATREYRKEREALVWRVYEKMKAMGSLEV